MKKARTHGTTEVYWFELDLADRAGKTPRNRVQPGIQFGGILNVIEALELKTPQ